MFSIRRKFIFLSGLAAGSTLTFSLAQRNSFDWNSFGIVRFGRAAIATASIAYDYKFSVYYKQLPDDEGEANKIWSQVHKRSAQKLLQLCRSNRGVFIKVGQHLGALDYLLPAEYVQTLSVLHSQAPESSLEEIQAVIKEDLNTNDITEVFTYFDNEPIGAASLAQVYRAKLCNNAEVAVKVQHPKVRAHSKVDIQTMDFLVRLAAKAFPDFKLLWLVDQTKANLPKELDFLQEAENAEKIRSHMKDSPWLRIPKIYHELSTPRLLVMEYCKGGHVNDLDFMQKNKVSTSEVVAKLGELYSEMIFKHGFIHCDPHPANFIDQGNILVNKRTSGIELCLLDHGLYTTLTDEFRFTYSKFWLSILESDVGGIARFSGELGVGDYFELFASMVTARSWNSITSSGGIAAKKLTVEEQMQIKKSISNFVTQISEVLDRIPPPMVLIFKTNDLLRGVEYALKTQKTMSSFSTMAKFCVRAVYLERLRACKGLWCRIQTILGEEVSLMRIRLGELILWFSTLLNWG